MPLDWPTVRCSGCSQTIVYGHSLQVCPKYSFTNSGSMRERDTDYGRERHMARVFAYCRVSTIDEHPENQAREIEAAGLGSSGTD